MHITDLEGTSYDIRDGLIADVYQDDDGLWYAPIYELDKDTLELTFHSFDLPSKRNRLFMIQAINKAFGLDDPMLKILGDFVGCVCDHLENVIGFDAVVIQEYRGFITDESLQVLLMLNDDSKEKLLNKMAQLPVIKHHLNDVLSDEFEHLCDGLEEYISLNE